MASRDFYFAYEEMVPGPVEHTFSAMTRKAARMVAGQWDPTEEERKKDVLAESKDAALSLSRRMEQFREAFLSALDGHSTERIAEYIKENYLENGE